MNDAVARDPQGIPERPVIIDIHTGKIPTTIQEIFRYYDSDKNRVYWTVVWDDELCDDNKPIGYVFNKLYAGFRNAKFGRVVDIEDFHYELGPKGEFLGIKFVGTFSGTRKYWDMVPEHYSIFVSADQLDYDPITMRPIVYVRTWSHLLHYKESSCEALGVLHEHRATRQSPVRER